MTEYLEKYHSHSQCGIRFEDDGLKMGDDIITFEHLLLSFTLWCRGSKLALFMET